MCRVDGIGRRINFNQTALKFLRINEFKGMFVLEFVVFVLVCDLKFNHFHPKKKSIHFYIIGFT